MRSKEFIVGLFIIIGFMTFVYISLQFGEFSIFSMEENYAIEAEFDNVSGLKQGAAVEMSGVQIGKVSSIILNQDARAQVSLLIKKENQITDDAIASIRTQGIIGDKFVKILQGGSTDFLKQGDVIVDTESAVDLEEMISKYIFGKI